MDKAVIWDDAYAIILDLTSSEVFFLRENGKILSNTIKSFMYCIDNGTLYEVVEKISSRDETRSS